MDRFGDLIAFLVLVARGFVWLRLVWCVPSRIWCCLVFGVLVGFFFCVLGLVVWVCYVLFCCFGGFGLWFAFGFRCFLVVGFWGGLCRFGVFFRVCCWAFSIRWLAGVSSCCGGFWWFWCWLVFGCFDVGVFRVAWVCDFDVCGLCISGFSG